MPDIAAFCTAYFIFSVNVFGYVRDPFEQASESFAGVPARHIVRITGNDYGGFARQGDLSFDQSACMVGKMMAAVGLVDMIADMSVIVYASAVAVTVADLADLLPFVVEGDPPYLFMSEAEPFVRRIDMERNQVDDSV